MASLHELKRTGKRPYRRVGRGQSSTRGKTAGRGGKGQTARAGHKIRPALRDIIKKLPKRRGYGKNRSRTVKVRRARPVAVPLARLERMLESGATVSPAELRSLGLIGRRDRFGVKLVGNSATKKFVITGCAVSASAKAAIEKAGGSVTS